MTSSTRRFRAGASIEDYCRACKTDRIHTVMAVDANGRPIRVVCDYCRSEHNYRGGPRIDVVRADTPAFERGVPDEMRREPPVRRSPGEGGWSAKPASRSPSADPLPIVSDRERIAPPMSVESTADLELLLRRIIREETGLTPVTPADKWRGGAMVLRPGRPGVQEKSWPIETFFHKVVMLRNRLRTLEQQLNASELSEDAKVKLQTYITGCYGSLTSFNVLFADEDDQFKGSGSD
jgi:hypothetical protein